MACHHGRPCAGIWGPASLAPVTLGGGGSSVLRVPWFFVQSLRVVGSGGKNRTTWSELPPKQQRRLVAESKEQGR